MREWERDLRSRLAPLRLDPTREAAIVEELSQHLDDLYAELRGRGLDHATARARALVELNEQGGLEVELRPIATRDTGLPPLGGTRGSVLATIAGDVRLALRSFRARPAFPIVAVGTFALGIGACALIVSAVSGVLRRPLPFPNPERLVVFWGTSPEKGLPEVNFPVGLYAVYRTHARTMSAVAAYAGDSRTLSGIGNAERIVGAEVSRDFFRVFNVPMHLGRGFAADEETRGGPSVVVLSHSLWQQRFGGDSGIVGRTVTLDASPTSVVGVMPPGFDFPRRAQYWIPVTLDSDNFGCWCYEVVGRTRAGLAPDDVRREIATITDDFGLRRRDIFPDAQRGGSRIIAMSLADRIVGDLRRPLAVLSAAVGLVLLIGCANIANLMLVRTTSRGREIAVRCCLGAGRGRIIAQLFTEVAMLAAAGSAFGLLLAHWGAQVLRTLPPDQFPRMAEIRLDAAVLFFTLGVAAISSLLCAVAPAIRAARVTLLDAITTGARSSALRSSRRVSDMFVVSQFALSLILLVGAGLLLRSYRELSGLDLGYRPDNVLLGRISLPYPQYGTATVVRALHARLIDRIQALPGVSDVGIASRVPLTRGNPQSNVVGEGREPKPGEPVLVANARTVTPGYFRAIGTPLLEGRYFDENDNDRGTRVGIVDETFASRFWSGESAVGKRFRWLGNTASMPWVEIVGVVRNVKHNRLDEPPDLQVYEPFAQRASWDNYLVIRSTLTAEALVARVRSELARLDPALPFYDTRTLSTAVNASLGIRRLMSSLLGGFALTALVLAAIGIYGVMALAVTARVREFGIRLALGAQTRDVRWAVLRHGLGLATTGVAIGVAGSLILTRFLQRMLFGVSPFDWITFVSVAGVLAATALLACNIPARRATRTDPIIALHTE
jgi:putative ABC transport system permease protein